MAVQPSRRAFLSGKPSNSDPWLSFLVKLRRLCQGSVTLDPNYFEHRAHLVPAVLSDIEAARSLCQQFGIVLCLKGLENALDPQRLALIVEPGRAWARPIPLDVSQGLWRVEAACKMLVLQAAGIPAAMGADPEQSLACWLALGTHHVLDAGDLNTLGIDNVEVMFSEGNIEVLGAFGLENSEPLRSIFMQRSVASLFETTQSARHALQIDRQAQTTQTFFNHWPEGLFRIDALDNTENSPPHLGQFMVAHLGRLGWVVAVTFRTSQNPLNKPKKIENYTNLPIDYANLIAMNQAEKLNQNIKNIFDLNGLFLP